ncbi:50S ribosomal protein L25 [Anthocerotibacter panamensis]|uniref:50S ribosomal protein L25 n=1 Tax=Anthocerotibacter panamensis TaxID=2857077 RepID=UPI001C403331|nr:50S ribosomal protein L25 [Anthocerotibacter panamensis]
MIQIIACERSSGPNPRALRRSDLIPAVVYGHRGTQAQSLVLNRLEAEKLLKKVTVNNTRFQLQVEDGWGGTVVLREVQRDYARSQLQHLSFFAIAGHRHVHLELPLLYLGEPENMGTQGVLEKVLTRIPVIARSDAMPEAIEVDVSHLEMGAILTLSDLMLPSGVEAIGNPELVVAHVVPSSTTLELNALSTPLLEEEASAVPAIREKSSFA